MSSTVGTKTEQEWEAEYDAGTLAKAEEIKADAKRLAKAQKAAKKLQEEKAKEAAALAKIANLRKNSSERLLDYPSMRKK